MASRLLFYGLMALVFIKLHYCDYILKNIKCITMNETFARFDLCEVKKEKFSMVLRLLQVPITTCNFQIEFNLTSVLNFPFMFNSTWDACAFMKNRKRYKAMNMFYGVFGRYTNLNHTCPYNHDIYVNRFATRGNIPRFPWPNGEYHFKTSWIMDEKLRVTVGGVLEIQTQKGKKF